MTPLFIAVVMLQRTVRARRENTVGIIFMFDQKKKGLHEDCIWLYVHFCNISFRIDVMSASVVRAS